MGEAKTKREAERARYRHGVVIQALGIMGRVLRPGNELVGAYLKMADHDADEGRGYVEWTGQIEAAQVFPDLAHAVEFYRRVSRKFPRRPRDGLPNRPLTIFSVEYVPAAAPGHKSSRFIVPGMEGFH